MKIEDLGPWQNINVSVRLKSGLEIYSHKDVISKIDLYFGKDVYSDKDVYWSEQCTDVFRTKPAPPNRF